MGGFDLLRPRANRSAYWPSLDPGSPPPSRPDPRLTEISRMLSPLRVMTADQCFSSIFPHAKDDGARAFYEHFTLEASPSDPYYLLLIMKDLMRMVDGRDRGDALALYHD